MWEFLQARIQNCQVPLLIGGDFNAVLQVTDRFQGNPINTVEVVDFQQFVNGNAMQEVRSVGAQYIWTNNQEGTQLICLNIDICFANALWLAEYADVVVERLVKGISNHCPQLLNFAYISHRRPLFKLYNVLADHAQFEGLVREQWRINKSQNLLRNVWLKCKDLKDPLKQLNTRWFLRTSERVEGIRQQLYNLQQRSSQPGSIRVHEEKQLLTELEH